MAQVTGLTAAKMLELADENIVDGEVVGSNLILTTRGGAEIDAGSVVGPPGPEGPAADMATMAELGVAIWELEAKSLSQDNGLKSWHGDAFIHGMNRIATRTLDSLGNPRLGIYRDQDRDQGFIGIDDYVPLSSYKGQVSSGLASGLVAGGGMAVSPDKKWLVSVNAATAVRVYPIDSTGIVSTTAVLPTPAALSANIQAAAQAIRFSPDGKAIFFALSASPFIEARPFDTATGVVGAKWANPATLPANSVVGLGVTPNSQYVVAGVSGAVAADAVKAWAINTTTGAFGAISTPATPFAAASGASGLALTEAGDYVIASQGSALAAWTFNQTTGAFGAGRIDAAGVAANNLNQGFRYASGKVVGLASASPYVHGWSFTGGVFGAKWANPATLPAASLSTTQGAELTADGLAFLFYDGATNGLQAYTITSAGAFGAKFVPSGTPAMASAPQGLVSFPLEHNGDLLLINITLGGLFLFGDKAGTGALSGVAETTTKTLPSAADSIYILDDSVLDAGVTRQYDVSLDGGATWTNNVTPGLMTNVPSGNQLRIRLTMTRNATGKDGYIYWFNCWAG